MSDPLRRVRRIYDGDPDGYHRAMSSRFTNWMLGGGRRKVGETVRGRVLDVGFGTGLSLALPDHVFDSVAFNLCLCTIPNPEAAIREAVRVARPCAPILFLEHVRSHLLPVALVEEAINPVMVALQADHFNRRTAEIASRCWVEVLSIDRWFLGVFNLIVGRAPGVPAR